MSSSDVGMSDDLNLESALREILLEEKCRTQEDLGRELSEKGLEVKQSSISRALKKVGGVRSIDETGKSVYRLTEIRPPGISSFYKEFVLKIQNNGEMIVLHTSPGTAPLVARHLDHSRPADIIGTIAGDDTVFVAKNKNASVEETEAAIKILFSNA